MAGKAVTKNISLQPETLARLKKLTREEMPTLSGLVQRLLDRELDRIEKARERQHTTV